MKAKHDYVATSLATIKASKRVVAAAALTAVVVGVPAHAVTSAKCRHDTNGVYQTESVTK